MFSAAVLGNSTEMTTTTTEGGGGATLTRQWSRGTLPNSLTKPAPLVTPPRTPKIETPPRTPKSETPKSTSESNNASPREKAEPPPSSNTPPKRLTKSYSTSNTKHRSDSLPTSHQKFSQTDSPTSPNRMRSISAKKQRTTRMDKETLDDQPKKASSQEAKCNQAAEPCKKLKTAHALPYIELCVAVSKIRISKHQ